VEGVSDTSLSGVSVLVAGAGLAGLSAARALISRGATVTVIDVRDRVGGRVWTIREGFAEGQHAEAGGDFIDDDQHEICRMTAEVGLQLTPILKGGFGYVRPDQSGHGKIVARHARNSWRRLADELRQVSRPYQLAERRWDSPITADLARRSVAAWLDEARADSDLRATAAGMRGFFLADPEELSLIALIDQFSESDSAMPGVMYRIAGGNDRLISALAQPLGDRLHLNTDLVALSHRG
jgi:monoamine oxidase